MSQHPETELARELSIRCSNNCVASEHVIDGYECDAPASERGIWRLILDGLPRIRIEMSGIIAAIPKQSTRDSRDAI
jgi:hypothetical protein